mmetsp:Transcript_53946/g.89371  ORF Transcript_53946/g.89371 Transcript_53946/m.89371 type:complete len:345 (-) Transcript_53946:101-1135(-)
MSAARSRQTWTEQDVQKLIREYEVKHRPFAKIAKALQRSEDACKAKYRKIRRAKSFDDDSSESSGVYVPQHPPTQQHNSHHPHRYPLRSRSRRSKANKNSEQQQRQQPRQRQQQQPSQSDVIRVPRQHLQQRNQPQASQVPTSHVAAKAAAVPRSIVTAPVARRPARKERQKLKKPVKVQVQPQDVRSRSGKSGNRSSSSVESSASSSQKRVEKQTASEDGEQADDDDDNDNDNDNNSDDDVVPTVKTHTASGSDMGYLNRVIMDGAKDHRIHWKPGSLEEVLTWLMLCVPEFVPYIDRVRPHLDDDEVTNVEALKCLDCRDWKDYGIKPILVRKKILKAVKYL